MVCISIEYSQSAESGGTHSPPIDVEIELILTFISPISYSLETTMTTMQPRFLQQDVSFK